jgi:hypothetical protein
MERKMDQKPAFSESLNAFQKGRFTVSREARRCGPEQLPATGFSVVLYRL